MENNPGIRIDVIVPSYNYESYVIDAVESLLRQTTPFTKIIVIDDGSTDKSLLKLRQYSDRITIAAIPNGGQLGACIEGLKYVVSDYVYFMDADDIAEPFLVEAVQEKLSMGPVKLQFQLSAIDSTGTLSGAAFPTFPSGYNSQSMVTDNEQLGFYVCPPTSGNIFQTRALRNLPLEHLFKRDFIDGTPALAMPYIGDIVCVNAPLARYRTHPASHSQWGNPTPELLKAELTMFNRRWEEVQQLVLKLDAPRPNTSAFVIERSIMLSALNSENVSPKAFFIFIRRITRSRLQLRLKIITSVWAIAVAAVPAKMKKALVLAKRSPAKRAKFVTFLYKRRLH